MVVHVLVTIPGLYQENVNLQATKNLTALSVASP